MDEFASTYLDNNTIYLNQLMTRRAFRIYAKFNPHFRCLFKAHMNSVSVEDKNYTLVRLVNYVEESIPWRFIRWMLCYKEDRKLSHSYKSQRRIIDNSDSNSKDYYSVAVVVKNEARYMREFILFYQVTGADRIYIYDNESMDNILDVIAPFVKTGFVIYNYWPGNVVQTAAYRDAIRRTKKRTKWLALIDADEFLFSPLGDMKDQLKEYEEFPGIGVNWVMFGPNGHDKRPEGLVMDNYTTTFANQNEVGNRHIKSIVQPDKVFTVHSTHFAVYKGRNYAVDEEKNLIDNTYAHSLCAGKAFTQRNFRSVFRINHYMTRSLEDLRYKCNKGYADGAPNKKFDTALGPFIELPMKEDRVIAPYADIVRNTWATPWV